MDRKLSDKFSEIARTGQAGERQTTHNLSHRSKPLRGLFYALTALGNFVMVAIAAIIIVVLPLLPDLPSIEDIKDVQLQVPLRIYSSDGLLLGRFGEQRRIPIRIEETPPALIAAVLAAEDDRYFEHPGVDYRGVLRAMYINLVSGGISQGASTITMQVARNFYLTKERTYLRKAREALLALRLEQYLTKEEILELYLNKIFLGHRAYGFGAAANVYYGRSLHELEHPQLAMLAALPKAPSAINPITNPERGKERRDYILRRMFELEYITEDEFNAFKATPLTAELHIPEVELKAPYVAEHIRQEMLERFGETYDEKGYRVYSTVRSTNQLAAVQSLREGLIQYDMRHGFRGAIRNWDLARLNGEVSLSDVLRRIEPSHEIVPVLVLEVLDDRVIAATEWSEEITIPWEHMKWARRYLTVRSVGAKPAKPADILQLGDVVYARPVEDSDNNWMLSQVPKVNGALVSINPKNGAVLAMVGGFDYFLDKFNRATQGRRLLGSNIKPFVYSAALDNGFTSASLISGAPIVLEGQQSDIPWRPQNYGNNFTGATRLREALARSLNLVSVRLIRGLGTDVTIDHISKFGFDRASLPQGYSLALGSAEATPLDVATGYAVFANGGHIVEPFLIDVVKDQDGRVIWRSSKTEVCGSCLAEPVRSVEPEPPPLVRHAKRVISSANAYLMTDLLRSVVTSGTGRRANSLNRADLAGKTGTTNDFEDAWFSGFNADIVATVWVGFNNPADLGRNEHGSGLALPIWISYMKTALQTLPEVPLLPPDNVVAQYVDAKTGAAVAADHANAIREVFIAGTEPLPGRTQVGSEVESAGPTETGLESAESALF